MQSRSDTYREYASRPPKPGKDQQAWDCLTEQHNVEPVRMFYRRTDGYPGSYSAEVAVLETVVETFRILRKEVPEDQSRPRIGGERRTRIRVYDDVPSSPRLKAVWERAARDHGDPVLLRLEHPARGRRQVTVTLASRQEIRFDLEKEAET